METNRLRQYCTIAETLNLRKAAEILNISHGGLYKSLKILEEELGFDLFRKEGRGIVLTEKGKSFYPKALSFLTELDVLLKDTVRPEPLFRIGTFEVFSTYFFSQIFLKEIGERSLLLQELIPGEMEKAILSEKIDVGITYQPIALQGLKVLEVGHIEMGIFGKRKNFAHKNFKELPFVIPVLPIESAISEVKGLDGWPEQKFSRNIRFRVSMLETALQLCSSGSAVGFFPKPVVTLSNQIKAKNQKLEELAKPKGFGVHRKKVYLVLRESMEENLLTKKLAKGLRQFCKLEDSLISE